MSILNRPTDGSPPVLLTLWRAVRNLEPMPPERLLALVSPESINSERARQTLTRWSQLRLFTADDGKVRLVPPFDQIQDADPVEHREFRKALRRLVLAPESNQDFGAPEPGGTADFTFVLAWLLSIDIFDDHLKSFRSIESLEASHIEPIDPRGSKYAIQNDTRWAGFQDWAAFLGFGWSSSSFQLDPSDAIEDELDEIFGESNELPIRRFVEDAANRLPVLDTGVYATRARQQAREAWRPIGPTELSPALSRGLVRLEATGHVKLKSDDDADKAQPLGVGYSTNSRGISHVQRTTGR